MESWGDILLKKHFNERNESINKRLMESWGYGNTKLTEEQEQIPDLDFPPEPNITHPWTAENMAEELEELVVWEKPTPKKLKTWRDNMTNNEDAFVKKIMKTNSSNFKALGAGFDIGEQVENIRNGIRKYLGLEQG